jgi:hypothetical protein
MTQEEEKRWTARVRLVEARAHFARDVLEGRYDHLVIPAATKPAFCNRHSDCALSNVRAELRGEKPFHCHLEDCAGHCRC